MYMYMYYILHVCNKIKNQLSHNSAVLSSYGSRRFYTVRSPAAHLLLPSRNVRVGGGGGGVRRAVISEAVMRQCVCVRVSVCVCGPVCVSVCLVDGRLAFYLSSLSLVY